MRVEKGGGRGRKEKERGGGGEEGEGEKRREEEVGENNSADNGTRQDACWLAMRSDQ